MKRRVKRRGTAIIMSLVMAVTMLPQFAMTAHAEVDDPAIVIGADILKKTSNESLLESIYMADIKWLVVGYGESTEEKPQVASSAETMTLLSMGGHNAHEFRQNWQTNDANYYGKNASNEDSDLKKTVDEIAAKFNEGEKEGIVTKTLTSGTYSGMNTDCIAGPEVKDALLWPLSTKEANTLNSSLRVIDYDHTLWESNYWWLRSPGPDASLNSAVAYVGGDGTIFDNGHGTYNKYSTRPAFNYKIDSVLLTSAANSGKSSGTVGPDSLKEVGIIGGYEWKLTVKDKAHQNFGVDLVSTCDKKTLDIKYSGAVTGEKEYISAIIKGADDSIKYYGNLKNCTADSDASGRVSVKVDGKLSDGDKLYVFNEQLNGDKKTDFASELQEIAVPTEIHDWSEGWSKDEDMHWQECPVCHEKKDGEVHSEELDKAVPATCTETGLTEGKHCSVCSYVIVEQKTVPATGHTWDAGRVTKAATEQAEGVKTYICSVCKGTKTEAIPKLKPSAQKVSGTPLIKMTAKGKTGLLISWNRIQGAAGYDIFFASCHYGNKKFTAKQVKTFKGNKTFKWTKTGLKKNASYKAYVKAYVYKNGKKTYVRTSPVIHAYTSNGTKNYTNARSVSVNRTGITLKKSRAFNIKARVNKVRKNNKLMSKSHVPTLRYMTSNSRIAVVNGSGRVTARAKGTCYVYVLAHNGVSKQIKVTVK